MDVRDENDPSPQPTLFQQAMRFFGCGQGELTRHAGSQLALFDVSAQFGEPFGSLEGLRNPDEDNTSMSRGEIRRSQDHDRAAIRHCRENFNTLD